MRLDKYLSYALGYTRKEAKKAIKNKEITVNGKVVLDGGFYIDVDNDIVRYLDEAINYEHFIYLMLNKPFGVISATTDDYHETVLDLIYPKDQRKNLFPVGRLDIDTEGLLFLTNNGKLAHFLTNPKHQVKKKYYVEVSGRLTDDDIEIFLTGTIIKDRNNEPYQTLPSKLDIIESGDISKAYVTVVEGKFHQVKQMFNYLHKEVIYLKRVMMKDIYLDENLEQGQYRHLTKEEIRILYEGFNIK